MTAEPAAVGSAADVLDGAARACVAALEPALVRGEDWARPARGLDWSCRQTLDHVAVGVVWYAGLLVRRTADRNSALLGSLDRGASLAQWLEGVGAASALLSAAVRGAGPQARAWHPWGASDATGFAAMGVVELTVHTHDIARALEVPWAPAEEVAAFAVDRLFPDAPAGHSRWRTLLWCTGRAPLPGLPRRAEWRWSGTVR
ncbi:maleylpyruvate isomerase N-terminal domain-containing protein [Marinitenerispora sediminis]|uniref:Mycothiol-dependent maleylpyruvate isomerase metal-binding domain-containing protein n=1 Tax=Marinitenerispora sediminis TaxID=1931232 RepID=A0A368SZB4_9ACTN|nr:maleylpyruvate isomerase N-terminal domain-containing protein [Marinitenerispora sediminis]RCV48116.1 hypothetical protein DEF28_24415 [Marinitenerispora sediminis]RCV51071.1 hypothetical protein DEF24_23545 [Marinitenerispora sediminis]RCV60739.1 hypothetical protein DEF23_04040 [Marinitenerispora sediminis]